MEELTSDVGEFLAAIGNGIPQIVQLIFHRSSGTTALTTLEKLAEQGEHCRLRHGVTDIGRS